MGVAGSEQGFARVDVSTGSGAHTDSSVWLVCLVPLDVNGMVYATNENSARIDAD